jgi:Tfp pilus assembly protein PilF
MHAMRPSTLFLTLVVAILACLDTATAQSPQAVELRNLGLAQLENEQDVEAEATYRRLLQVETNDPLPLANLAVALLRQAKTDEALETIELALRKAPERGDLLAIKGEILAFRTEAERAIETLRAAAEGAPAEPRIQYSLYRHATTIGSGATADAAAEEALRGLADLRPENLVVLLQLGKRALEEGDRALATRSFLRVRELLWQADPVASNLLAQTLDALEAGDLETALRPSRYLANVLMDTPMFQSSLAELYNRDTLAIPVERFADEPDPTAFGDPVPIRFAATVVATAAGRGSHGLVSADLDGDGRPDIARLAADDEGTVLEIRLASAAAPARLLAGSLSGLLVVDLDNDGHLDLLAYGGAPPAELVLWRNRGDGSFEDRTASFGLDGVAAYAASPIDFDSEGDLDLAVALPGERVVDLWQNRLEGPLVAVGRDAMPHLVPRVVYQLLARDLDRDGDTDLLLVHENGLTWLDNLRQGRFQNRSAIGGLRDVPATRAAESADLDNDGRPELVLAVEGRGLVVLRNLGGVYEEASPSGLPASGGFTSVVAFDADNDGRLDLAASSAESLVVFGNRGDLRFEPLALPEGTPTGAAIAAADMDRDGDLDLLVSGEAGLVLLDNDGGNANHWLTVRLRGLDQENQKNNHFGYGASLEVRVGLAYQYREVTSPTTHFGLGLNQRADSLRMVWANGVPQHRIHPEVDQWIVEEQVLKGSCPFLYTWNGETVTFVTDLLWGAPIGMPVAPGQWADADPQELVLVEGAQPRDGHYDLRITEELWEAAYFDFVRLWVVDHPADVEVASSLRIVPGESVPERVLASRNLRTVARAWDGRGREVTRRLAARDDVYADGHPVGDYQGLTPEPWSLTFDLGVAPAAPVRLLLDGWVFPADASLNLALAQRGDLPPPFTRLEVLDGDEWRTLLDPMGFFAGKTKTMVIDTPALPPGASRLRIVTSRWLSFDRLAWSTTPADDEAEVVARLTPARAELRHRGFSRLVRHAPNAPHAYDYTEVSTESPWLPLAGRYTRFGDVRELLEEGDDRLVILAAGDDLRVLFDVRELPPPAPGHERTVFLESYGWDKDADRNTWEAQRVEPLPFRAMSGYPYGPGETYPDSLLLREYRERWLTREIAPPQPLDSSLSP